MTQRNRVPKSIEEAEEERKRKKNPRGQYERPSTAELLELAGGTVDKSWKSDTNSINERTKIAQKVKEYYFSIAHLKFSL